MRRIQTMTEMLAGDAPLAGKAIANTGRQTKKIRQARAIAAQRAEEEGVAFSAFR